MLRKMSLLVAMGMVFFAAALPAQAATMFDSRAAWEAAVGAGNFVDFNMDTLANGSTLTAGTVLTDGTGGISFNQNLSVRQVGAGWATWSGVAPFPRVLFTNGYNSVTGTFVGSGPEAFGLEMEPDTFKLFSMTMFLSDGSSLTRDINGNAGAGFFGWTEGYGISSITLSTTDTDFAFGRVVYSPGTDAVPEPSSMLLFGVGGAAFGFLRRRQLLKA